MNDVNIFRERLREDFEDSGLSIRKYAEAIGITYATMRDWLDPKFILKQPIRTKNRKILLEKIPDIFSPPTVTSFRIAKKVELSGDIDFELVMKFALAKEHIIALGYYLQWFLEAPDRRKKFREQLGKDWEQFLNLTRGMVSEEALKIAVREGRIQESEVML